MQFRDTSQIRSGAAEGRGWGEEFRRTLASEKFAPTIAETNTNKE